MALTTANDDVSKILNCSRIPLSVWNVSLLLYLPFGLLLLVFRLCLIPQALLLMLIIPDGSVKRFLLWIFFTVMGLTVINKNFEKRSISARMLIANSVSYIDYLPFHVSMDCTTSSISGLKPLLSLLFYHHTFPSTDSNEISVKLKKIPEFDDNASIPDSVAVPFIAQPEPQPTNGKGLLKFSDWPFTAEDIVQPLAVTTWRPLDINITTVDSSELADLLWLMFCPFTIFTFQMLPVVESRSDISLDQFAKKAQKQISTALEIPPTDVTAEEIKRWKDSLKQQEQSNIVRSRTATGPIISELDFSKVRASSEIERMVHQVLAVLPDAPLHAIRRDLLETRSVDVTLTKFLDGRIEQNPLLSPPTETSLPPPPATVPQKGPFSLQDCHVLYNSRKSQMVEEARRRYVMKHGERSH